MRLLVFGRSGQVARALQAGCPAGWFLTALDRNAADLRDPDSCARAVERSGADAVINAAAWTDVDGAETREREATLVNAAAPGAMASAAAGLGIPFLHLSSDYVFPGQGTAPHAPDATAAPLSAYGRSKLAGERAIRAAGDRHLILRTSWVFSPHGRNFVTAMLRLGGAGGRVRVVCDQAGGPTAADDIAAALFRIAPALTAGAPGGTHHFAGAPCVSWSDFAREIFRQAGLFAAVEDIPASAYPAAARRPANSRLDCASLTAAFGIRPPDWRAALGRTIAKAKETCDG